MKRIQDYYPTLLFFLALCVVNFSCKKDKSTTNQDGLKSKVELKKEGKIYKSKVVQWGYSVETLWSTSSYAEKGTTDGNFDYNLSMYINGLKEPGTYQVHPQNPTG